MDLSVNLCKILQSGCKLSAPYVYILGEPYQVTCCGKSFCGAYIKQTKLRGSHVLVAKKATMTIIQTKDFNNHCMDFRCTVLMKKRVTSGQESWDSLTTTQPEWPKRGKWVWRLWVFPRSNVHYAVTILHKSKSYTTSMSYVTNVLTAVILGWRKCSPG